MISVRTNGLVLGYGEIRCPGGERDDNRTVGWSSDQVGRASGTMRSRATITSKAEQGTSEL